MTSSSDVPLQRLGSSPAARFVACWVASHWQQSGPIKGRWTRPRAVLRMARWTGRRLRQQGLHSFSLLSHRWPTHESSEVPQVAPCMDLELDVAARSHEMNKYDGTLGRHIDSQKRLQLYITTIDQVSLNQSFNLDQVQQLKVISVSEDSGLLKLKVVL